MFFKKNPMEKLKKQRAVLLEKAMFAQRNGDIKSYAELSFEAEQIYKQIQGLELEAK